MKKIIYLKRHGFVETYETRNTVNSNLGYYARITTSSGIQKESRYQVYLSYSNKSSVNASPANSNRLLEIYVPTFEAAKRTIERAVFTLFRENVEISDTIERYCHGIFCRNQIDANDKYFAVCVYSPSSETIRLLPENYCLVNFGKEGTKDYLETDAATKKYLPLLTEQAQQHEKEKDWDCHKNAPVEFHRERFAWLIGEAIKKQEPDRKVFIRENLIEC